MLVIFLQSENIWEPISISQTMLLWKPVWVRQQSYAVVKKRRHVVAWKWQVGTMSFPRGTLRGIAGMGPSKCRKTFRRHIRENEAPWSHRNMSIIYSIMNYSRVRDLFKENVQSSIVPNCWCFCLGCCFSVEIWRESDTLGPPRVTIVARLQTCLFWEGYTSWAQIVQKTSENSATKLLPRS